MVWRHGPPIAVYLLPFWHVIFKFLEPHVVGGSLEGRLLHTNSICYLFHHLFGQ
jgi:hypothetical protein